MKKISDVREAVADITVDPRNKIKKSADQNQHALTIAKNAKRMGLKSSMMGKHVRISGNKKAINDFLRITIGKSSYGDPTEKDMTTPQIDKMLTKGLKENNLQEASPRNISKALDIANKSDGNYTGAVKAIEKIQRGLSKVPKIAKALKQANESVEPLEENSIPKIKQIVAKKQAMKIDGVMVDMFTASAISQIYDKVNDGNKKKMEKMKVTQLANAAMKLMQKNSVNEGLWDNIRAKRARGEKMRSKGEKGAPTQDQIKRAQGEEVEEKIKMDIKKPFVVYKKIDRMGMSIKPLAILTKMPTGKELDKVLDKYKADGVMNVDRIKRNNVRLKEGTKERTKFKMDAIKLMRRVKATTKGHKIAIEDLLTMTSYKVLESMFKQNPRGFIDMLMKMNPKRDKLQVGDYMIDGRFVAPNGNVLSVDQTKKLYEGAKDKAFRDFRRQTGGRRGVDPADQDMKATDDDRKAASKNIIMQLRRVSDLPRGGKVEFENGKSINVTKKDALRIGKVFDTLRKPQDKAKFQAMIYKSPADMKKILSKLP